MTLIDGRALAASRRARAAAIAADLGVAGSEPRLAAVVPTGDEATAWFVRSIARAAEQVGIQFEEIAPAGTDPSRVTDALAQLYVALENTKPGDRVEVVYYRGNKKITTQVQLSYRGKAGIQN